jgi:protein-S-isoprenylcysteine O-methyltransferase Ste14
MTHEGAGEEHPSTHKIILGTLFIFIVVYILDSFVFGATTILFHFIPLPIRIVLSIFFVTMGLIFMRLANVMVFNKEDLKSLKKTGIYAYVRNPMYLGLPLIYIGLFFLTISLASLFIVLLTILSYNIFVKFEESNLKLIFGQEYLDYQSKVHRWLPRITPAKFSE